VLKTPEFVVDGKGRRTKVIPDIEDNEKLLEALEEIEDIRALTR
jgi:hypothetical protein